MKLCRAGDRALQLLLFNEEFLVSVSHQLALITSLPFVHTARRYYRLNGLVSLWDWQPTPATVAGRRKLMQTWSFRGSKSRNKVSVGEPAEGSLVKARASHTDGATRVQRLWRPTLHNIHKPVCTVWMSWTSQEAWLSNPFLPNSYGLYERGNRWTVTGQQPIIQLSTTDLLVLPSMKNAAKRDR